MAHLVGKIDFSKFIEMRIAEVEYDDRVKRCICIPIEDNDIKHWNDEWQYWFRIFRYRQPLGKFIYFFMKYIPRSAVNRMSQSQIEMFSKNSVGGLMKSDLDENDIIL